MQNFNILAIGQAGRLQYEAILLAASLRHTNPDFPGKLFIAVPQAGPRWPEDPAITDPAVLGLLADLGAEILPFANQHFGASYPYGNKIEALSVLPDAPFLFLDTDTLVTGRLDGVGFDFARPSASMRREGTWPQIELYGPGYSAIWGSLYRRFGLSFDDTLDHSHPDEYWRRYLYFNAGWFFHESPARFGARFLDYALTIRDDPPAEAALQVYDPWLDQVALPLVIHSFGGGRPGPELAGLDGDVTCHWRALPLMYARESDLAVSVLESVTAPKEVRRVLREFAPVQRMVYRNEGQKIRRIFQVEGLPAKEQALRNRIKRAGLWVR